MVQAYSWDVIANDMYEMYVRTIQGNAKATKNIEPD